MKQLNVILQAKFDLMCKSGSLFTTNLGKDDIWNVYLKSFGKDEIFRDPNSSVHNCNHCKNFIRRYADIISLNEKYEIVSMFDVDPNLVSDEYRQAVIDIATYIRENAKVENVFIETFNELNSLPYEKCTKNQAAFKLGVESNTKAYTKTDADKFGVVSEGDIKVFEHMSISLPKEFIDFSGNSYESLIAPFRDAKNVFERGINEISLSTIDLVLELIDQDSILNAKREVEKINAFRELKSSFEKAKQELNSDQVLNWLWINSKTKYARFRNDLIGVLCIEIEEGIELNIACQNWNKRSDPANWMKAKAPITQKQIEQAEKRMIEKGYENSFNRRFANIEDIRVDEIIHSNVGEGKIKSISLLSNLKPTKSQRGVKLDTTKIDEISIKDFLGNVMPNTTDLEVYLENRLEGNLAVMTTAIDPKVKNIMKWSNPYSWTFKGNLAGKSMIKEAVSAKGGKVDGVLRFSIMWADGDGDNSDLDAHCKLPNQKIIYFSSKVDYQTGGNLDIDIQQPCGSLAVENITFPLLERLTNGNYEFMIHQYATRGSKGFKAEIEFNGQIYSYEYPKGLLQNEFIRVATVNVLNGQMTITHHLKETASSKDIWGLKTNEFHKVNLVCNSPNHWGDDAVGNKHFMFMLENCRTQEKTRSFHVENLVSELLEDRKVLEVFSYSAAIQPNNEPQLAGLGFNETVRDSAIFRIGGKKLIKVNF